MRLRPCGFQHVECAQRVNLKILARVFDAGGDGYLRGQVHDEIGLGHSHSGLQRLVVSNIAFGEVQRGIAGALHLVLQPMQIVFGAGAREIIENGDVIALRQMMRGEVTSHKARAAGNKNMHSVSFLIRAQTHPAFGRRHSAT